VERPERTQISFFTIANEYYAAGRIAALSALLVSANLLHHAVEMYLKGAVAHVLRLAELRKLGHDLPNIWRQAKQRFADPKLDAFDIAIEHVHPFERLRYPDAILKEGATIRVTRLRKEWLPEKVTKQPGPIYDLVLEDVDELVEVIFGLAKTNPIFFCPLNPSVLPFLNEHNPHAIFSDGKTPQ
jgi:hypothetical protein